MPEPEDPLNGRSPGRGRFAQLVRSRTGKWLLGGAGVVVIVIVAAAIVVLARKPHNVSNPNVPFISTTVATQTSTTPPSQDALDHFAWPTYGYDDARTRDFTGAANLHPPFRQGFEVRGNALLEFSPVIYGHMLFFMDDSATVKAVDTTQGHLIWQRSVGTLSAASPGLAIKQGLLVVPTLSDNGKSPGDGQIVALSMRTGKEVWHRSVPSGTESSPLVFRNTVFFGDQAGTVYSLNVNTGHVNWTFQASGSVKGGPALAGDNLYVDDYGGHVYDISARTGHQIWSASSDGGDDGFSSGTFYSTPTVAFGRVYVGNTSGFIYSFSAKSGELAWSYDTGAYVYSSAAVADTPGLGPTVYMGSYNGDFYALNAQSGKVRWIHPDARHDAISGSATIVDNVVYYSDLHDKLTTGLNATTGRTVFSFADGAFTPVVADPDHIYVNGGYVLYELLPKDGLPRTTATKTSTRTGTRTKTGTRTRTKTGTRTGTKTKTTIKNATATSAGRRRRAARGAARQRADARRTAQRRAEAEAEARRRRAAEHVATGRHRRQRPHRR